MRKTLEVNMLQVNTCLEQYKKYLALNIRLKYGFISLYTGKKFDISYHSYDYRFHILKSFFNSTIKNTSQCYQRYVLY